jgi:FKBP12-rapamycin complex-associated protein
MSIVGYILGLGDRNLNNLLMNRETGKIVHIDLSDCFEIAMKRDKFPEKVPFRLTRMLVRALGITEVEGNFRITCEKTLFMLKYNRDSLIAILSALVHNPLISFKLLIPLIMKKRRGEFKIEGPVEDKDIAVLEENASSIKKIEKKNNKRLSNYNKNIIENKTKEEDIEGKDERQIMEREQRQIFSLFEETDDIDTDELYKIAQIIIQRINNKLIGIHYNNGIQLSEKEQVEYLIREARSYENLVMSYLGWTPYW